MDILIRLRVLLWLMVLSLWGLMLYQFLGEEEQLPQMRWVATHVAEDAGAELPDLEDQVRISAADLFPARPDDLLTEPSGLLMAGGTGGKLARIPASLADSRPPPGSRLGAYAGARPDATSFPKPIASRDFKSALPKPVPKAEKKRPERERDPAPAQPLRPKRRVAAAQAPKGFTKLETQHFIVYSQGKKASLEFLETLENLHGNLMLDLAAFSPWARDHKVSIYLFRDQESYRKVTGRPSWSGGASSVKRRKIYLYETDELVGILAHELCHIYFDSFFASSGGNPLWLSEGMATLIQTERGLAAPNWLGSNLATLRRGGGYSLKDLMRVDSTSDASDDDIRLWYSQSFSVVRFMIRSQYRSSFYKFCRFVRDGLPLDRALYRAYGMPFNRIKALEYAWRYDLTSKKS